MERPTYDDLVELTSVLNRTSERVSTLEDKIVTLAGLVDSLQTQVIRLERNARR